VVLAHLLRDHDVVLAHLNHSLRDRADADEQFVKDLAVKWGLKLYTEKKEMPESGNLENNAREIRYAFLEKVRMTAGADYIAVAHHFDDQIETVLMHMARGAGLRGKRGMKKQRGDIIRPLLDVSKAEIEEYAKENRLGYCIDETNFDMSFERNRTRHIVIPELKKQADFEAGIRDVIKKATEELAELEEKAKAWIDENLEDHSFDRTAFNELPEDLRAEILIQFLGAKDLYQKNIQLLIDFLETGQSGKKMSFKSRSFLLQYDKFLVDHAERAEELSKTLITETGVDWGRWSIVTKLKQPFYVRAWRPGDRFQPSGMQGHKKLQDLFVDEKIPRTERSQIPVIVDENDAIIAVGNIRRSHGSQELMKNLKLTLN